MVYNGYYKVMSNIPKMGQLPTPDVYSPNTKPPTTRNRLGLTFYRGVIFLGSPQDETTKQKEMVTIFHACSTRAYRSTYNRLYNMLLLIKNQVV